MPQPTREISLTESEILTGLHQENPAAFAQLFRNHFAGLCDFAFSLTRSTEVAEDIVADTFTKLLQRKPSFETYDHLRAHLHVVVKNAAIDWLKSRERHERVHAEISSEVHIPAEPDIERALIKAEVLQAVYTELQQLPPACAEILRLSLIDELSIAEIAGKLDVSPQTVMNQKSKGIKLLRIALLKNSLLTPAILVACLQLLMLLEAGLDPAVLEKI